MAQKHHKTSPSNQKQLHRSKSSGDDTTRSSASKKKLKNHHSWCDGGFRNQRHVEAFATARDLFSHDVVQLAQLSTGITMEYALHEADSVDPDKEEIKEEDTVRVMMVMGYLQRKEAWCYTLDFLVKKKMAGIKKLQVLTFDNRGTGNTDSPYGIYKTSQMAQDALALLDYVGWQNVHLVGISMGGMISLEMASAAPERLESLTLMVTSRGRFYPEVMNIPSLLGMFVSPNPEAVTSAVMTMLYPESFLQKPMEDTPDKTVKELLEIGHSEIIAKHEDSRFTLPGMIGQSWAVFSHYVSDERLQRIRDHGFPILVFGAKQDRIIPTRHTDHLMELLSGDHVRHVSFEDAGHGLFVQYAEEIVDELCLHISKRHLEEREEVVSPTTCETAEGADNKLRKRQKAPETAVDTETETAAFA